MQSFLEKIIKRAARVDRPGAGATSGIASLAFNGSPDHEVLALIANVFLGDALQNRLRAFKSCAGVEIAAGLDKSTTGNPGHVCVL